MSVRGCFQGVIGAKATEVRLREINKEFTYLTRESDIKKGKFILSWLSKDGLVKHTTTPNPSARNNFKKLEDALPILENMILSNDDCVHPIPPRDCNTSDENNTVWILKLPRTTLVMPVTLLLVTGGSLMIMRGSIQSKNVLIVTNSSRTPHTGIMSSNVKILPLR